MGQSPLCTQMEVVLLHIFIVDSDFPHRRKAVLAVAAALLLLVGVASSTGCAREQMQVEPCISLVAPPALPPPPECPPPPESSENTVEEKVPAICPVKEYTRISSRFGQKRRKGSSHKGIDMEAPRGTPVVAAAGGLVKFCGWHGAYGNIIEIDHGNDYETAYAHLNECMVNEGEQVQQGQKIGHVGVTGNATAPHLHYELRCKGVPMNPESWLP